jgi:hypothetical protein
VAGQLCLSYLCDSIAYGVFSFIILLSDCVSCLLVFQTVK